MYVPYDPLWTWTLYAGEDGQLFSQPTMAWYGDRLLPVVNDGACVARCQCHTWITEADDSHTTHPIQCGQVAGLAPDGSYLCDFHRAQCWL